MRVFDGITIGVCAVLLMLTVFAGAAWGGWLVATYLAVVVALLRGEQS